MQEVLRPWPWHPATLLGMRSRCTPRQLLLFTANRTSVTDSSTLVLTLIASTRLALIGLLARWGQSSSQNDVHPQAGRHLCERAGKLAGTASIQLSSAY
jgi:hypothetical protein